MKNSRYYLFLLACCLSSSALFAQKDTTITKDLVYAEVGSRKLLLDIYKLSSSNNPYLIVWVHGGAWRSGSKESPPLGMLSEKFAIASLDFRLSTEGAFPGPVQDIKAAIRYLRAQAKKYGYRSDKIVIWGSSSGGHLAALVGTTNNDTGLEGKEGAFLNESSSVQAIVDFYGPTNFKTILFQSTPHGLDVRVPALTLLLGKPVEEVPDLARKASPVFQVDASDPPILIVHGDQDNQVPVNQSLELMAAYKKLGLRWQMEIVPGAGHGDKVYYQKEFLSVVTKFLNDVLDK